MFPRLFAVLVAALVPLVSHAQDQAALEDLQVEMSPKGGSAMMLREIVLLRHGEPDIDKKGWFSRSEARAYARRYNQVGVLPPAFQPIVGWEHVDTLLVSSLPRAQSTAEQLAPQLSFYADSSLKEMELQIVKFPLPPMPIKWWTAISRGLWLAGLNHGDIESAKEGRRRARNEAARIDDLANRQGRIVVVAHGMYNHFLAKYLQDMGWQLERKTGRDYLGAYKLVKLP